MGRWPYDLDLALPLALFADAMYYQAKLAIRAERHVSVLDGQHLLRVLHGSPRLSWLTLSLLAISAGAWIGVIVIVFLAKPMY